MLSFGGIRQACPRSSRHLHLLRPQNALHPRLHGSSELKRTSIIARPFSNSLCRQQDASSTADSDDITVTITQDLKNAFLQSIKERNISLQFVAGSWDAVLNTKDLLEHPYDVVLTSETIYRTASLPSLISLLRRTCGLDGGGIPGEDDLAAQTKKLSLKSDGLCLVAAKILYFGVGGGIIDFENMVHGWMSARADLQSAEARAEFERGYGMVVAFLKEFL